MLDAAGGQGWLEADTQSGRSLILQDFAPHSLQSTHLVGLQSAKPNVQ